MGAGIHTRHKTELIPVRLESIPQYAEVVILVTQVECALLRDFKQGAEAGILAQQAMASMPFSLN